MPHPSRGHFFPVFHYYFILFKSNFEINSRGLVGSMLAY